MAAPTGLKSEGSAGNTAEKLARLKAAPPKHSHKVCAQNMEQKARFVQLMTVPTKSKLEGSAITTVGSHALLKGAPPNQ